MLPRLPNHCKDGLRSLTHWHSLREPTTVRSRQSGAPSDEGLGTKQQQITAIIVTPPKTRRRKERTTRKKGMRRGGGRNKKRECISRAQCHPHTPACLPHSASVRPSSVRLQGRLMSPWYSLPWLSQAWQPIIGTEVQEPSSAYLQCSVIAPGKGSHVTDMMPEPANLGWATLVAAEKLTSA